jgi:hypothetical protein
LRRTGGGGSRARRDGVDPRIRGSASKRSACSGTPSAAPTRRTSSRTSAKAQGRCQRSRSPPRIDLGGWRGRSSRTNRAECTARTVSWGDDGSERRPGASRSCASTSDFENGQPVRGGSMAESPGRWLALPPLGTTIAPAPSARHEDQTVAREPAGERIALGRLTPTRASSEAQGAEDLRGRREWKAAFLAGRFSARRGPSLVSSSSSARSGRQTGPLAEPMHGGSSSPSFSSSPAQIPPVGSRGRSERHLSGNVAPASSSARSAGRRNN